MVIIPAVDIRGGKVVRLSEGDFGRETVYGDDPVKTAEKWEQEGAQFLHIVDLDGARKGEPVNFEVVSSILKNVSIPVEVGGGIRSRETMRDYVEMGATRVILGTEACSSPGFMEKILPEFGDKAAVSIDSRDGLVAIQGWKRVMRKKAVELIKEMENIGVQNMIWTDVKKDGLMNGIDVETAEEILKTTSVPITIAGGVSSLEDVMRLKQLKGVWGIIIGKALYAGAVKLREAMEIAGQ